MLRSDRQGFKVMRQVENGGDEGEQEHILQRGGYVIVQAHSLDMRVVRLYTTDYCMEYFNLIDEYVLCRIINKFINPFSQRLPS